MDEEFLQLMAVCLFYPALGALVAVATDTSRSTSPPNVSSQTRTETVHQSGLGKARLKLQPQTSELNATISYSIRRNYAA